MFPFELNIVGRTGTGMGFPLSRARRGFGSKVSTADTPPDMNRKITLLAFEGKWPGLEFSGFSVDRTGSFPSAP